MFSFKPQHDVKRIVACVDGTWYNADGKEGKGTGNVSNTFRVFASVKQGTFEQGGKRVKQVAKYFHGIGVKTNAYEKYSDGYTGGGTREVIRDVYQYCCSEVTGPNDELWLFGFSRGAYVVRAVSALFRDMATLDKQSTGQFKRDYKEGLEFLSAKQKKQMTARKGELYNFLLEKTREGPVIQFLGLFDTVKQASADVDLDLSYSRSIRRVRHALALNEDRAAFSPEVYATGKTAGWEGGSVVQAWFVGHHMDVGGGARDDGLALYPLQWVLVEAQRYGLVLEQQPPRWVRERVDVEHPPALVMPSVLGAAGGRLSLADSRRTGAGDDGGFGEWKLRYASGIEVDLFDLRSSHQHGDLQRWADKKRKRRRGSTDDRATHGVQLNPPEGLLMAGLPRRARPVFDEDGGVVGYNPGEPYGTIIHPSVFFLQDTYPNLGVREALQKFGSQLDRARKELRPAEEGGELLPWMLARSFRPRYDQVRILVCGRSGVGKSTLLNRIFGVDLTDVNDDARGVHDIDRGFESDQYPGVVIHDSEGFEAGDTKRTRAFAEFLKKRAAAKTADQQLHAVWICNEMGTRRPIETSLELVLEAIVQHHPDLPVFLIGTKKDEFLRLETDLSKAQIRALEAGKASEEEVDIVKTCEEQKRDRWMERLRTECSRASQMLDIQLAFVSRDDVESVKSLMRLTIDMLLTESVRSSMVAAQSIDVDLKISLAIRDTMRLLRTAVKASSVEATFLLSSPVSAPTYSRLLCGTIAQAFGLSRSTSGGRGRDEEIDNFMSAVVWPNLSAFMSRSVLVAFGNMALLVTSPILQAPLVTRMILKCACDLILVLDRATRQGGRSVSRRQMEEAVVEYQRPVAGGPSLKTLVHRRVNALVPVMSALVVRIYRKDQVEAIREGVVRIVEGHRIGHVVVERQEKQRCAETQSLASTLLGSEDEDEDEEDLKKLAELRL